MTVKISGPPHFGAFFPFFGKGGRGGEESKEKKGVEKRGGRGVGVGREARKELFFFPLLHYVYTLNKFFFLYSLVTQLLFIVYHLLQENHYGS